MARKKMESRLVGSAGLGVDAAGNLAIDPTSNVRELVDAEGRLTSEKIDGLRRELSASESHRAELRKTDLERLDALREVDRLEARDRDRATQTAVETLAKSNSSTAETLRATGEGTARNLAAQLESYKKEMEARLNIIERFQAAGSGKAEAADPALAKLFAKMDEVIIAQAAKTEEGQGAKQNWTLITGILAAIVLLITIGTFVFITLKPATQPQIIYVPTPVTTPLTH